MTIPSIVRVAEEHGLDLASAEFAAQMDAKDPLKELRKEFLVPKVKNVSPSVTADNGVVEPDGDSIYLCGNSLGLQPIHTKKILNEELEVWAETGVHGHFDHKYGRHWRDMDELTLVKESARIVGAEENEIVIMNTLTSNLHFMLVSFYRPTSDRYKILMESKAFPSDYYALESQVKFHGYDPKDAIIEVSPREGEFTLRPDDILEIIEREGDKIALVMFSGIQYYTGQFFPIPEITKAGQAKGCVVGWDLAHAVGNLPMYLHDWNVDFACWCTYKYLNSGPGCIAGAFVHSMNLKVLDAVPRFHGWFGNEVSTRFRMENVFRPDPTAAVYRLSNPSVMAMACLLGSLTVFAKTSMEDLRAKSLLLTGYLDALLDGLDGEMPGRFQVLTPKDPTQRGCQLSLLLTRPLGDSGQLVRAVFQGLLDSGVVCDLREPDVIRVAPTPLYNTFSDVRNFFRVFREQLIKLKN
ncbi:pyridoxal phosphate-dependent transferase [Cladochytrium replicatum]|nr:pyridoxal phosphate-dependent transferase [Cladochytrium replicatum]